MSNSKVLSRKIMQGRGIEGDGMEKLKVDI